MAPRVARHVVANDASLNGCQNLVVMCSRFVVSDSYLGPDIIVQVKLDVKQGPQPEELMPAEDEIESEDSEQEFMLSDEDDEEDF